MCDTKSSKDNPRHTNEQVLNISKVRLVFRVTRFYTTTEAKQDTLETQIAFKTISNNFSSSQQETEPISRILGEVHSSHHIN